MLKLIPLIVFALVTFTATGSESPPDITGANKKVLNAHLGKVVSLHGKLDSGMFGETLEGATKGVVFYIVAEVPPGGFTLPESWMRLHGQQVLVTGTLEFHKAPPFDGTQVEPSYYYMVLQKTEIRPVTTK
jgi:hypothetical protein